MSDTFYMIYMQEEPISLVDNSNSNNNNNNHSTRN